MLDSRKLSVQWFDKAMFTGPLTKWKPKHPLDIFREWDEKYKNVYNQPISPFLFAVNCSAIYYASINLGACDLVNMQVKYMELMGDFYVKKEKSPRAVYYNNFKYNFLGCALKEGFYGSFMNAYMAYGYMKLYEAGGDHSLLIKAFDLLETMTDYDNFDMSGFDTEGNYWLYEYVFGLSDKDKLRWSYLGGEFSKRGNPQARIFNGHMHALISLVKYKVIAKSKNFDAHISAAYKTMLRYLPEQIYENKFFSYSVEAPAIPDYGQLRAVQLVKNMAEIFSCREMLELAERFDDFYKLNIEDLDKNAPIEWMKKGVDSYKSL